MFNPHLSTTSAVLVVANMLLATVATVVSRWAVEHIPLEWTKLHIAMSTLGGMHVVGYAWLLFFPVKQDVWLMWMRGPTLLTWCVVWIAPPLFWVSQARTIRGLARHATKEIVHDSDGGE